MPAGDGCEPIADEEIIYRRISENSGWYNPDSDRPIAWVAFKPNRKDINGLSVWRAKYVTAEKVAAKALPGRRYYVIALRAKRLREIGIAVEPSVEDGGVGHASLTNMNYRAYQKNKDKIRNLSELISAKPFWNVFGPYGPFEP